MTSDELAQITQVIETTIGDTTKVVKEQIDSAIETHVSGDEHRFVQSWIAKEERIAVRNERIKGNFIIFGLLTATSTFGLAIWQFFIRAVNKGDGG